MSKVGNNSSNNNNDNNNDNSEKSFLVPAKSFVVALALALPLPVAFLLHLPKEKSIVWQHVNLFRLVVVWKSNYNNNITAKCRWPRGDSAKVVDTHAPGDCLSLCIGECPHKLWPRKTKSQLPNGLNGPRSTSHGQNVTQLRTMFKSFKRCWKTIIHMQNQMRATLVN